MIFEIPPEELPPAGISFHTADPGEHCVLRMARQLAPADPQNAYPYDVVGKSFEADLESRFAYDTLYRLIEERLSEREVTAIRARFGLETGEPKSYRGISQELGLSKTGAFKIVQRSLDKLRVAPDISYD